MRRLGRGRDVSPGNDGARTIVSTGMLMSAVRVKDADGAFYGIGSVQIAWTGESWKCATLHP